jgi:hypothetical protein
MGTIGTGTGTYLAAKAAPNEVEVHSSGHQERGNGQPVRSDAAIRQDDELRIGRGPFHPAANCRYFSLGGVETKIWRNKLKIFICFYQISTGPKI